MTGELERVRDAYLGADPDAKPLSFFEMLYTFILPFGSYAVGIAIPLYPVAMELRSHVEAWWQANYSVEATTSAINSLPNDVFGVCFGALPAIAVLFLVTSLASTISKNMRL